MKKKPAQSGRREKDEAPKLGDLLQADVFAKLKETQKELVREQENQKEEEIKRKREEARQREKNKSFEELLGESDLNWKNYK